MGFPTNPDDIVEKITSTYFKAMCYTKGGNPGFSHHLKCSYNTIDKNRISIGPNSLTYRYKLSETVPKFSVGLLTALMDELSTSTFYHVGAPGTPGLSVQMQTELVAGGPKLEDLEEIDIINVVTKFGRTISFTKTDFRDPRTNELVAYSSQVKYMLLGNWLFDKYFTNSYVHDFFNRLVIANCHIPQFDHAPLFEDILQSHLVYSAPDRATFLVTRDHINPMRALHGGCHAMIMEQAAETFAKEKLQCDKVMVESMQLENLSPGKGSLDIVCEALGEAVNGTMNVRVMLMRGNRTSSVGTLKLVAVRSM